jgi:uncharacterized protein (DUF433 family)
MRRQHSREDLVKIDSRAPVVIDPEILGGDPVFRGTRVPVHLIAAMLERGATLPDVLTAYPRLTSEIIDLAPEYVRSYPLGGATRAQPWRDRPPVQRIREHLT